MTTTQYLRAFARYWWVLGLCVLVGVSLPLVFGAQTPRTYVSSTGVLVRGTPATQPSSAEAYQATLLAQQRMATYNDLANSPTLAEAVLDGLDTDLTVGDLSRRMSSLVQGNSTVLRISVEDTDADGAQVLASRAGRAMVKIINRLERQQARPTTLIEARVVTQASDPTASADAPWRNPPLGGAVGLLVGLALAVALSRLDPRLRDEGVIAELVGAPVLGVVPASKRVGRGHSSRAKRYDAAVDEVRTGIFFLRRETEPCLTVALTSPLPSPGLADLTRRVAQKLTDVGQRVLLVETGPEGRARSDGTAQDGEASGGPFDVVQAGAGSSEDTLPLHSDAFAALLAEASEQYDYVLVTAPATSQGTDAAAVAARCDVTVLAVDRGSREKVLRQSLRPLVAVEADLGGVVLLG